MNKFFKRRVDVGSDSYASDMQSYFDYIKSIKNYLEPVLIKYFLYDFFHDSTVCNESFNYFDSSFSMTINCVSFTDSHGENSFNVDFNIQFFGVKKFIFENSTNSTLGSTRTFLCSEIGAVIEEDEDGDEYGENQFIIMELMGEDDVYYLSFTFSSLTVQPVEPLTFKMLTEMNLIKPTYPECLSD